MTTTSTRITTSQGVLDSLESLELGLWKVVVERVAVVELRMNQRCSDDAGSVEVQGCAYASEVTYMMVASHLRIRHVLVEGKV